MGSQKSDCSHAGGNPGGVRRTAKRAWVTAFAGMCGVWGAVPVLAHEDHEHGLPGMLHPVSADHSGWLLLAAAALLVAFALRKPILKALKARSRR